MGGVPSKSQEEECEDYLGAIPMVPPPKSARVLYAKLRVERLGVHEPSAWSLWLTARGPVPWGWILEWERSDPGPVPPADRSDAVYAGSHEALWQGHLLFSAWTRDPENRYSFFPVARGPGYLVYATDDAEDIIRITGHTSFPNGYARPPAPVVRYAPLPMRSK